MSILQRFSNVSQVTFDGQYSLVFVWMNRVGGHEHERQAQAGGRHGRY